MSKTDQDIRVAMRKLVDPGELVISGKVLSYDAQKCVVDLDLLDGRVRYNITLQASEGLTDGIIFQPKVGSMIVAARIANTKRYCLINCDDLEEIRFKIGNQTLVMNDQGFVFNGGNLNGMVKIDALIQKINQLEQKMSIHQHAYVSSSGPAVTTGNGTQTITPQTTYNDLANDKVKQ